MDSSVKTALHGECSSLLWPSLVVIGMFYYFPSEQQLIFFVPFPYIHWLVYHCAYHQRIRMCRSDEIWNEIWNETQMEFIWATLDNRNDDKICWLNKMARKMTMLLMVSPSWSPHGWSGVSIRSQYTCYIEGPVWGRYDPNSWSG